MPALLTLAALAAASPLLHLEVTEARSDPQYVDSGLMPSPSKAAVSRRPVRPIAFEILTVVSDYDGSSSGERCGRKRCPTQMGHFREGEDRATRGS